MTVRNIRSIDEYSFAQLMERFQKFKLPIFQRVYSWEEDNWSEFFQTIIDLIEENKREKGKNIHFIGSVILQEKKENEICDIIDGQQRIITVFVLLSVLFRKLSEKEGLTPKEDFARQTIRDFCVLDKNRLRVELNNKLDQKSFEMTIKHNLGYITDENYRREELKTKIAEAEKWFVKEINNNVLDYYAIYDQLLNRFHFSLVILGSDVKPWDLFMALNNTGLNLNVSDLLKSLLISKLEIDEEQEKASEKWDEKIVEKICGSDNTKINSLLPKFLLDFWWAEYGKTGDTKTKKGVSASKSNLYSLFENKFKKEEEGKVEELLDKLAKYADLYWKVIEPQKNADWWKNNWSEEMFLIICDIKSLEFKQLFSVILSVVFRFKNSEEFKPAIINKVKRLLFYMFREVTIRGGFPRNVSNDIIFPLLNKAKKGRRSIFRRQWIIEERIWWQKNERNLQKASGGIWGRQKLYL